MPGFSIGERCAAQANARGVSRTSAAGRAVGADGLDLTSPGAAALKGPQAPTRSITEAQPPAMMTGGDSLLPCHVATAAVRARRRSGCGQIGGAAREALADEIASVAADEPCAGLQA